MEKISDEDEEVEVLEFRIGNNYYGIFTSFVKEIVPVPVVTSLPNCDPRVEGIFMLRDKVYSVVNLPYILTGSTHRSDDNKDINKSLSVISTERFIIVRVFHMNISFHVEEVSKMKFVKKSEIESPDAAIKNAGNGVQIGIIHDDDRLVILLDFEKIIKDIVV